MEDELTGSVPRTEASDRAIRESRKILETVKRSQRRHEEFIKQATVEIHEMRRELKSRKD